MRVLYFRLSIYRETGRRRALFSRVEWTEIAPKFQNLHLFFVLMFPRRPVQFGQFSAGRGRGKWVRENGIGTGFDSAARQRNEIWARLLFGLPLHLSCEKKSLRQFGESLPRNVNMLPLPPTAASNVGEHGHDAGRQQMANRVRGRDTLPRS